MQSGASPSQPGHPGGSAELARDRSTGRLLHDSGSLEVWSHGVGEVHVGLRLSEDQETVDALAKQVIEAFHRQAHAAYPFSPVETRVVVGNVLNNLLGLRLTNEFQKVVEAYRDMLHEQFARGHDEVLRRALERARLQERILAGVPMADQSQACELLGLSATNTSATMGRKEAKREILRFNIEGRPAYPLFQFDVEGRRIHPVMKDLLERRPAGWSDMRLLHWLTRPHLDFGGAPAEVLGTEGEAVLAAFEREIVPPDHG